MKKLIGLLLLFAFIFQACQKELSFENDGTPSEGSLQSDVSGDCLPKNVAGIYEAGTALDGTNYIEVQVDVTATGAYTIYTDTVNGMWFRATGTFTSTGLQTVKLTSHGTPVDAGIDNFVVTYNTTFCVVNINVLPAGGAVPAVFTLDGAPNACMDYDLQGVYIMGTPLSPANKVILKVTVTSAGTYNISTIASNGMVFSGSGSLAVGAQTIELTGSGTPTAAGTTNIPVTIGTSTCSFECTVDPAPINAGDYFPRTPNSNWSYEFDNDPDDSLLRKVIPDTHAALGNNYNIFMIAQDVNFGFDSSGYYRKAGGDYFEYVDITGLWGFDNEVWLEYIFLKDNVAVNTAWQSDPFMAVSGVNSGVLRLNYKVAQKDVDIVVKGVTYNNTIVVEERLDRQIGTNWEDTSPQSGYFKSYYARNIGLIKQDYVQADGNIGLEMNVRRYQVF